MRIISLVNQKGGVGKTTTTANLGSALAQLKKRVLMIDLDPQANLTVHFGISPKSIPKTIADLFRRNAESKEVIFATNAPNLSIIPSSVLLASIELDFADIPNREKQLADRLKDLDTDLYDFVLIDSPPSLGIITLNGLHYAKEIVIPLQVEFFAMEGMIQLLSTISQVRAKINPQIKTTGIVATMYDTRTNLSEHIFNHIKKQFGDMVFQTIIRDNVRIKESPCFGKDIFGYDPNSFGAEDYLNLAKEVIKRG